VPRISPSSSLRLLTVCVFLLSLLGNLALHARSGVTTPDPLSDLNVAAYIKEAGGGYTDLFTKLKKHEEFKYLCAKYSLDDPGAWPALQRRFIPDLVDSSAELNKAKSMMETKDTRSGLDGRIISAESTRTAGRALYNKLSSEIIEMQHLLRLIDELKVVLERVASEHALSETVTLSSLTAQSLLGQVLLFDSNDLIVKRKDGGYFRIPARMLSESTKLNVLDSVFDQWSGLPHLVLDEQAIEKNAGELVAYNENLLYIIDRFEGLVSENRAESQFTFEPYEDLIEVLKADDTRNADKADLLKDYEEALALNNLRVEAIAWYESRLGTELIVSQREKAKAYREELNAIDEAELEESDDSAPEPDSLNELDSVDEESAKPAEFPVEPEVSRCGIADLATA